MSSAIYRFNLLSAVAGFVLVTSCKTSTGTFDYANARTSIRAGIVRAAKFQKAPTLFWSHFDATKRASIVNTDSNGNATILAEVSPDAALQRTLELAAKTDVVGKVSAETQLKTATTIAQLGQRTANVNMLRDALYRLAEVTYNNDLLKPGSPLTAIHTTNSVVSSPSGTAPASTDCNTCGTMYERLFKETL